MQSQLVMPGPQSVFAAVKADQPAVTQEYAEQPSAFCLARYLLPPVVVSTTEPASGRPEDLFVTIVEAAAKP
jgi:hypothetical protein